MIRINKIINKIDLFDILKDKDVASIQIQRGKNEKLTNPELCRINIYYTYEGLNHLVATCLIASELPIFTGKEKAFLRGLGSAKTNQFIRASVVYKLIKLEEKSGVNLGISKQFRDFAETNKSAEW